MERFKNFFVWLTIVSFVLFLLGLFGSWILKGFFENLANALCIVGFSFLLISLCVAAFCLILRKFKKIKLWSSSTKFLFFIFCVAGSILCMSFVFTFALALLRSVVITGSINDFYLPIHLEISSMIFAILVDPEPFLGISLVIAAFVVPVIVMSIKVFEKA